MNFLDVLEPVAQRPDVADVVIGIDFGTTNSLACIMDGDHKMKILTDITSSIVSYSKDGTISVGKTITGNVNITSIKRLIGSGKTINVWQKKLYPEQIASEILRFLKIESEKTLGTPIKKSVITVPAYFEEPQRQAVKFAANLAGLDVLHLISEPTSAGCFYGIDNQSEGNYAVFDLGGGTFDVSVLTMQKGVLKVSATGGDTNLGGDDFDKLLSDHLQVSIAEAKSIKESLSDQDHAQISCDEFDSLVLPLIHKMVDIFKQTLEDAGNNQLVGIILVGGSTRMRIVKEAIQMEFNVAIFDNLDPDRIVAFGAALQAHNIAFGTGNILLDVIPLSLGIETAGGSVEKIIERNSNIPLSKKARFTTSQNNQTGIVIHVLQGERDMAEHCRSLAKFELSIPKMNAGLPQVDVVFDIDANGILSISATEEKTGITHNIDIKPSYGISEDEVRDMLIDAVSHAQEDIEEKFIVDTKIEARGTINSLRILMSEILPSDNEKLAIETSISALEHTLLQNDRKIITKAALDLDNIAKDFAERAGEKSLQIALAGKNIHAI